MRPIARQKAACRPAFIAADRRLETVYRSADFTEKVELELRVSTRAELTGCALGASINSYGLPIACDTCDESKAAKLEK